MKHDQRAPASTEHETAELAERQDDHGQDHHAADPAQTGTAPWAPMQALAMSRHTGRLASKLSTPPVALPHRSELEAQVDQPLDGIEAHVGESAALAELGGRAAAEGDLVAFADPNPDRATVAHEVTHVLQARSGRPANHAAAEAEADRAKATGTIGPITHGAAGVMLDADPISATDYLEKHAATILVSVANLLPDHVASIRNRAPANYAPWTEAGPKLVASAVAAHLVRGGIPMLRRLVAPQTLENVVDRARVTSTQARIRRDAWISDGSADYTLETGHTCIDALLPRIADALVRVTPRYLVARVHAQDAAWEAAKECNASIAPEPAQDQVLATHPMDRPIIEALCGGRTVTVDLTKYRDEHPVKVAAAPAKTVPVVVQPIVEAHPDKANGSYPYPQPLAFGTRPQPVWVRAIAKDARVEDVALTLFGDTTYVSRLTAAAPLFAFDIRDRHALLEPWKTIVTYDPTALKIREGLDQADSEQSGNWHGDQPPLTSFDYNMDQRDAAVEGDPLLGLDPTARDEAALGAAPPAGDAPRLRGATLLSMQRSSDLLGSIGKRAEPLEQYYKIGKLGFDEALGGQAQRIDERRARLRTAPDADIARWDAHAAAQESVLARTYTGLLAIADDAATALKSVEGVAHFQDLAREMRVPIQNVLSAYVGAAAASDLPSLADVRLVEATRASSTYKVDMMDLILQQVEVTLAGIKPNGASAPMGHVDRAWEVTLRQDVARVRMLILSSDPSAGEELKKLWTKIQTLQLDSTMLANMDSLDEAWRSMDDMADRFGVWGSFDTDLRDLQKEATEYRGEWTSIYAQWAGVRNLPGEDGEAARRGVRDRVTALSKRMEQTKFLPRMQHAMENAGAINAFAKVVGIILMIIVTQGVALLVEGIAVGAGLAAGGAAITTIKVVADAVVFTALHTAMFAEHPTLKSVAIEFAYNLLLFGAMRKVSSMLEASKLGVFLAEASPTYLKAAQLGAEGLVLVTGTLARAEVESVLDKGRTLTKEEAAKITLETVAVFIATALAARVAGELLAPLRGVGGKLGAAIRRANVQRARVRDLANAIQTNKNVEDLPELLKSDGESLKEDIAALEELQRVAIEEPALLKKAGLNDTQINELAKSLPGNLTKLKVAQHMGTAEHVAGEKYNVPQAEIGQHLASHTAMGGTVTTRKTQAGDAPVHDVEYPDGTKFEIFEIAEAKKPPEAPEPTAAPTANPPATTPPPAPVAKAPADDYTAFGDKHGLGELDVMRLRDAKADLKRVEALIKGGKSNPGKAPERAVEIAVAEIELAARLEKAGIASGKEAQKIARWAGDADIIGRVDLLLNHVGGNYKNPEKLPEILEWIGKGSKQHVQALDDALARLAKNHEVRIEAEADVVDDTTKEAVQHKQVSGGEHQLGANVKSAAKQLAGKGAADEVPKPGYDRVADVRLTPSHPKYKASPSELHDYLVEMKAQHDRVGKDADADPNAVIEGLDGTLEVRITNANGTFRFKGPDFKPIP